jgi:hypothetical protein
MNSRHSPQGNAGASTSGWREWSIEIGTDRLPVGKRA